MIKTYTKDTLTREVLERGVKLRVIDEQHSAAFQRACFDLKVFWWAGEGERHTSEPFLFVEVYRGITLLQYASGLAPFDFQPETEIYFDDGRLSTSPDTQFNKAYIMDFSRSGCIETVIDDGRPAFQRLRGLGVLFDSKQDAQRWLDNHIEGEKWLIQQKRKSCTS